MKNTIIALSWMMSFIFCQTETQSQWVRTNGPYGGHISVLTSNGDYLYAGTTDGLIFISSNNGNTWTAAKAGNNEAQITAIKALGSNIIAATNNNIYLLVKQDDEWFTYECADGGGARSLNVVENTIFSHRKYSSDRGVTWTKLDINSDDINTLVADNHVLFAGTVLNGVLCSNDGGKNWDQKNNGMIERYIHAIAIKHDVLFTSADSCLYYSNDHGDHWNILRSNLNFRYMNDIIVNGNKIFTSTDKGIFVSNDDGKNWSCLSTDLPITGNEAIAVSASYIFIGTDGDGIFRSNINGKSWESINAGLCGITAYDIEATEADIYTATNCGVYRTSNKGNTWIPVKAGLPKSNIYHLSAIENNVFAANGEGIYLSTNRGLQWSEIDSGLTNKNVWSLSSIGQILFAGISNKGIYRSTDYGTNWSEVRPTMGTPTCILAQKDIIYSGTSVGSLFISKNKGDSWEWGSGELTGAHDITVLTMNGSALFAGTAYKGVYRTTDYGKNWNSINSSFSLDHVTSSFAYVTSLLASDGNIYSGTLGGGVAVLKNDANIWIDFSTGLKNHRVWSLEKVEGTLYAGVQHGEIYYYKLQK